MVYIPHDNIVLEVSPPRVSLSPRRRPHLGSQIFLRRQICLNRHRRQREGKGDDIFIIKT